MVRVPTRFQQTRFDRFLSGSSPLGYEGTKRAAVFPGSESRKFQGPNTLPADGSGLEDGRVRFPGLLVHSSDPINHP
jgi:hypothetical protein